MRFPTPSTPQNYRFKTPRPANLTDKQSLFAEAYAIDSNITRAALAAGYSPKGDARSAQTMGAKTLRSESVQAYVKSLRAELALGDSTVPGSSEWIRARYIALASVSPADYVTMDDSTGVMRWKRPDELTEAQRAAIADISFGNLKPKRSRAKGQGAGTEDESEERAVSVITGYKLHSAPAALDALARINGMHKDTVQHDHRHDIRGIFALVESSEATSETSARLRAKHGAAGARVIEHEPDLRPLRRLRGV